MVVELYVAMYDAASSRDINRVLDLQQLIMQISTTIYTVGKHGSSYLKGLKCALAMLGIINDDFVASPFYKFEAPERLRIQKALEALPIENGFGCSFFKKGSSADEFTSAGHSIPGWVVGMSIFATYVSSISYIGYPGKAFAADWNAFVFSLSIPIASYFAAKYFVPFYRHSGSVSAYTFLEEKFGAWARLYASACYLLTQIARMGSILYLLAVPMYILMGWDMHTVIILP